MFSTQLKSRSKLVLLLFFLQQSVFSQPLSRYAKIDEAIIAFSKKKPLTLDSVIAFVNSRFKATEEKVRAYYTFISHHITYDVQRLDELMALPGICSSDGPVHYTISQNPKDVFDNGKGVCEGISRLMVKFCEGSGIKADMVVGHCKTPDGEIAKDMGHAWNAIRLDSAWTLIDITWSFGYVNFKREFVKEHSNRYFGMAPQEFVLDHLPLDPMWQLLRKPVSKAYFFNQDSTGGKYYSLDFNFNDSIDAYFKKNDFDRSYTSLLNYHKFDPQNMVVARNVDVFINNQTTGKTIIASIYYDEFISFYNNKLVKQRTKANCKKALEMLYKSQTQLGLAQAILKNKTALTPEFRLVFKKLNEDMRGNAASISKNIQMIKELQKTAK
jgi:hypothetical protein